MLTYNEENISSDKELTRAVVRKEKNVEGAMAPTQSYGKSPYTTGNAKKQVTTQKRHQKFDYTTTEGRLRTVSWSNNNHQTGVVKPVYWIPTFQLTTKALLSKWHKGILSKPCVSLWRRQNKTGRVCLTVTEHKVFSSLHQYLEIWKAIKSPTGLPGDS